MNHYAYEDQSLKSCRRRVRLESLAGKPDLLRSFRDAERRRSSVWSSGNGYDGFRARASECG